MRGYLVKVTLKGIKPTVWRRASIAAGMTFAQFAMALNDIMGWRTFGQYTFTTVEGAHIHGVFDHLEGQVCGHPQGNGDKILIDSIFAKDCRLCYSCMDSGFELLLHIETVLDDYQYRYLQVLEGEGQWPPTDCADAKAYIERADTEVELLEEERPEYQLREIPHLKEVLSDYQMDDLKRICKEAGIYGFPSLRKRRLVDFLAESLTKEIVMEDVLRFMTDEHLVLFEMLFERTLHVLDLSAEEVLSLEDLMYCGYVFQTTKGVFLMPPEIKESYQKLNQKSFRQKQRRSMLVADYCQAAVNLYGIAEIEQLINIFNEQNDEPLKPMELQRTADTISRTRNSVICQKPGYIYDDNIEWDIFDLILDEQKGKPYYIPEKEVFLCYADTGFWEKSPAWELVKKFFIEILDENCDKAEQLCHQLYTLIHIGAEIPTLFDAMEDLGVKSLEKLKDAELAQLSDWIKEAWNTTRMITNRGFSPNEISSLDDQGRPKKKKLPDNVIPFPGQ